MPSAISSAPRIPAWQRLGLKLKSAPSPDHSSQSTNGIESAKRKRIDTIEETPSKKSKKASNTPLLSISNDLPATPHLTRKKSVTFTPETKVEDGDSIKQLFSAWVSEQRSQDPSFALNTSNPVFKTPEPPKVEEKVDTTLDERERRVKRVKKSKQNTEPNEDTTKPKKAKSPKSTNISKPPTTSTRPFLSYLKQYHESRDSWKFNKNHQNQLLKHAFDVEVIPCDYAHLIYIYVRGLQGGVRTRLRDAAIAIKVKDQEEGAAGFPENMADRDKRQREYDAAMNEYVASMTLTNVSSKMGYEEGVLLGLSDAAMASRVAKRMRSEKILAELGTSEGEASEPGAVDEDDDSQKRLRVSNGSSQKLIRKRKQRTAVADDTSSSDESSDSDSSSGDDAEPIKRNVPVDTSSSSSSSSSSGSDDEDEDDDEDEEDDDDEGEDDEDSDSD